MGTIRPAEPDAVLIGRHLPTLEVLRPHLPGHAASDVEQAPGGGEREPAGPKLSGFEVGAIRDVKLRREVEVHLGDSGLESMSRGVKSSARMPAAPRSCRSIMSRRPAQSRPTR